MSLSVLATVMPLLVQLVYSQSSAPRVTPAPTQSVITGDDSCPATCAVSLIGSQHLSWSKYITPVVVGTAIVIINDADNSTTTTTSYASEIVFNGTTTAASLYLKNGTIYTGPTPTAAQVETYGTASITYPTPYTHVDTTVYWQGTVNYTESGTSLCATWGAPYTSGGVDLNEVPSPLQTPVPFSTSVPPVDSEDPYGAYYKLMADDGDVGNITAVWPEDYQLQAVFNDCTGSGALPVGSATSVRNLIDTTTTHISSGATTSSAEPSSTSPLTTPTSTSSATAESTTTETTQSTPASSPVESSVSTSTPVESSTSSQCENIGCVIVSVLQTSSATSASVQSSVQSSSSQQQSAVPVPTESLSQQSSTSQSQINTQVPTSEHGSSQSIIVATMSSAVQSKSTGVYSAPPTSELPQSTQTPQSAPSSSSSATVSKSSAQGLSKTRSVGVALAFVALVMVYTM